MFCQNVKPILPSPELMDALTSGLPDARDERPPHASLQEPSAFEYRRHRLFDSRHSCRRLLGCSKVVQVTPLPPRRQRLEGALKTRVPSELLSQEGVPRGIRALPSSQCDACNVRFRSGQRRNARSLIRASLSNTFKGARLGWAAWTPAS